MLAKRGSPAIVESIRAGLVFQLKEAVGADLIQSREEEFIGRAVSSWDQNSNLRILGPKNAPRLSIVSFLVRHGDGYLHHNFVVALLNDLFGIQTRGGCSCAGPYGHRLLGIDLDTSRDFECEVLKGWEGIKPGWVRINFNYFISERIFDFLLEAVHWVANHGWRLLPSYRFDPETAIWRHRRRDDKTAMRLHDVVYEAGRMQYSARRRTAPESALGDYLAAAERLAEALGKSETETEPPGEGLPPEIEELRWFPLPSEIWQELHGTAKAPPASNLIHVR